MFLADAGGGGQAPSVFEMALVNATERGLRPAFRYALEVCAPVPRALVLVLGRAVSVSLRGWRQREMGVRRLSQHQ